MWQSCWTSRLANRKDQKVSFSLSLSIVRIPRVCTVFLKSRAYNFNVFLPLLLPFFSPSLPSLVPTPLEPLSFETRMKAPTAWKPAFLPREIKITMSDMVTSLSLLFFSSFLQYILHAPFNSFSLSLSLFLCLYHSSTCPFARPLQGNKDPPACAFLSPSFINAVFKLVRVHGFSCILSDSNANDRVNCVLFLRVRVKMCILLWKKRWEKKN